ncbi:MAG: DUF4831 family protein [Rikenellaceae bacterium]
MKFLLTIVAATATFIASAQSIPNIAIGAVERDGNGGFVSEPSSTILVDIEISSAKFTAGPYARYSQKYLGERAPLTDKISTSIIGSTISLAPQDYYQTSLATLPQTEVSVEVEPLPVDRISSATLSPESAAQSAASEIFAIRKTSRDMISGDLGDGVFGAGFATALEKLEELESGYVALFMGQSIVTSSTQRFAIKLKKDQTRYMVCRYDPAKGILPASEVDGEPIYIQIIPSEVEDATFIISRSKSSAAGIYITPNIAQCDLYLGANIISSSTLPLYDFGSRVTLRSN